ncbi:type II toxin-antitoxin system HipA family toxin [Halioxenophilus sp. WMMB6]|uniref:type II toxin-antitoxin system HipA family toxin n=1 Tax=Halioxenophilus sp. WMMB6 TaxID=3073815 RepID=UPI00295F3644|nr:type II toxin-antitoxin system HipA family toxin [Halioxenophilus sp. WMMB6]
MAAEKIDIAEVVLWGRQIGTIIWSNNRGYFEYSEPFQASGIELSPIKMPLSNHSYSFGSLNRETFKGLPGLLADSLPDKFGNKLIDQWLEKQGRSRDDFSPVERLCYIGSRGMGAIEFEPAIGGKPEQSLPIEIAELVGLANEALSQKRLMAVDLNGDGKAKKESLEKIISVGTSAGGARAKAVIAWNKTTNEVKSGQIKTEPGFSYWLLKFDGVEENRDHEILADPKGFSLVEYAYYLMAIDCGVTMAESRIFSENGRSHFMTKRFDRKEGGEKIHMHSLCGIAHYDFNSAGAYSYEQAMGVMRDLRLERAEFEQFFRRMVFNVVARNQDDHTKNIAFLMDKSGHWTLSPAYDITHCNGAGWTSSHQMTINGKRDGFTLGDLMATARHADIKEAKAKQIVAEVVATVAQWPDYASRAGVPERYPGHQTGATWSEEIEKDHRLIWQGL